MNEKFEEVTWEDLLAKPEKYESYFLWYGNYRICVGEHAFYFEPWVERLWPMKFEFNDIDSFLLTAHKGKGISLDFDLTDQQRNHIIEKLQSKWGNFRQQPEETKLIRMYIQQVDEKGR